MRIVSGDLGGRRYSGKIPDFIRPTTDKVRESIFNSLNNLIDFDDAVVADICAGTGFLGFESISRGAEKVYYFEKNRKAVNIIKQTASDFKIDNDKYDIIQGDANKSIKKFHEMFPQIKFDIIFFDPPYQAGLFDEILSQVAALELLSKEGIFLIESSGMTQLQLPTKLKQIADRTFGSTRILMCKSY